MIGDDVVSIIGGAQKCGMRVFNCELASTGATREDCKMQ